MSKTTVTETTEYTYEGYADNRRLSKRVKTTVTETFANGGWVPASPCPIGPYLGDLPWGYGTVTAAGAPDTVLINKDGVVA